MNFEELSSQWQQKKTPANLENVILEKITNFDEQLKKENTRITYWLIGVIYITGITILPFISDKKTMLLLGGIWFLIGIQSMIFWFRQINLNKSMIDNPMNFIDANLSKLNYNKFVTNLFMPLYMLLLGILSSYYLNEVLDGISKVIIILSILCNWIFYLVIFYLIWNRQRKRDQILINPQIKELKKIKANFNKI